MPLPNWVTEEFLDWLDQCPEQWILTDTHNEYQRLTYDFMFETEEEYE